MYQYVNIVFLLFFFYLNGQSSSNLLPGKVRQKIAFKSVNNLIILPLKVNDIEGNFILDTGIKGNILFLVENKDFHLKDSLKTVKIRGFGYGEPIEAYISEGNSISYKNMVLNDKSFYLINDEKLNYSAKTGITIHGIVGADIFRNNVIKVDYKRKRLTVYDTEYFYLKKYAKTKSDSVPLVFHGDKPYIEGGVKIFENDTLQTPVKLLIDTGGTDALWLFKDEDKFENLPPNYFTDFIGESLTGSLHGDKSRIEKFTFGGHEFGKPVVSFLDDEVANSAKKIKGRNGTLGAGILSRFTIWFDYKNHKILVKRNSNYENDFHYNMSGLEINYNGDVVVLEFDKRNTNPIESSSSTIVFSYRFALKPSYVIANVRKGSPGYQVGLKVGDVLLEINNTSVQEKSYGDLVQHFYKNKNKIIKLLVERDNEEMLFKFQLIDELD